MTREKLEAPEFYLVAGGLTELVELQIAFWSIDHEQLADTVRNLAKAGYFNFWLSDAYGNELPSPKLHKAEKAKVTFE